MMAIPPEMLAQFASPSGLDPEAALLDRASAAGAAATPEKGAYGTDYFDVSSGDGWTYRQYADGKIKIITAPEGHRPNAVLDGGPAYDAIRMEIERLKGQEPPPPPVPQAPALPPMQQSLQAFRQQPELPPGEANVRQDFNATTGLQGALGAFRSSME